MRRAPDTLRMTRRRARPSLLLLPLLVCLCMAAATLAACGAADKVRAAADPVEEAAAATAKAGGAKVEMRIGIDAPGAPSGLAMTATGVIDIGSGEMQMTMDMGGLAQTVRAAQPGLDPDDLEIETRVVDKVMYLRMGLLAGRLPGGKRWIKLDMRKIGKSLGVDVSQFTKYNDPAELLEFLRSSGDVEELGSQRIRGIDTTRYRARIDLGDALDELRGSDSGSAEFDALKKIAGDGTLPVEVWIGADKLVRRMSFKMSAGAGTQAGEAFGVEMRMDLFAYGTKVSVEAPPAAEVADGAKLLGGGAATTP